MIWPLLALLAADCSVNDRVVGPMPTERQILASDSRYRQWLDTLGRAGLVAATPAQAFDALKAVYADFDLPVTDADPEGYRLAMRAARCIRTVGKSRLSRFLECGRGITGSNADHHRITMTVISTIRSAAESKASISTYVTAEAVDISGGSSDRLACSSTGQLEKELHKQVSLKLAEG